jgi:catechol 2,3-dioxygenase-like lactoylglutathione lyase family enzyme
MISSIAYTGYPVEDIVRARRFYESTLGLTPAESFGDKWQEYDIGCGTFSIIQVGETTPDRMKARQGSIALEVDDLDTEVQRLKELNVPIIWGPNDGANCKAATIENPDGNLVWLHQSMRANTGSGPVGAMV